MTGGMYCVTPCAACRATGEMQYGLDLDAGEAEAVLIGRLERQDGRSNTGDVRTKVEGAAWLRGLYAVVRPAELRRNRRGDDAQRILSIASSPPLSPLAIPPSHM